MKIKTLILFIGLIIVSQLYCDTVDSGFPDKSSSNSSSQYFSEKRAPTGSYIIFKFEDQSIFVDSSQSFLTTSPKYFPFYMSLTDDVISNSNLRQLSFLMSYVDSTLQGLNLSFDLTYGKIPSVKKYEVYQKSIFSSSVDEGQLDRFSFNLVSLCHKPFNEKCDYTFETDFSTLSVKSGTLDIVELTSSHIKAQFDIDFISKTANPDIKNLSGEFLQIF